MLEEKQKHECDKWKGNPQECDTYTLNVPYVWHKDIKKVMREYIQRGTKSMCVDEQICYDVWVDLKNHFCPCDTVLAKICHAVF